MEADRWKLVALQQRERAVFRHNSGTPQRIDSTVRVSVRIDRRLLLAGRLSITYKYYYLLHVLKCFIFLQVAEFLQLSARNSLTHRRRYSIGH